MLQNWKTYKLGALIEINTNSLRNGEINWINYIDIKSVGSGIYEEPRTLAFKDAPSRARRILHEGDTVISSVRPNLKSFFYAQNLRENTIASTGFVVLTPKFIDSRFLYYLTTNDGYIDFLVKSCTGSAYPAFGPNVIINSEVTIPDSISEQRSIASILSAIDDKIELNLQMNKTLEEMAMALYKHWFVDFGPFQDGEFVDSELGMIPKGWEVKSIGDFTNILDTKRVPLSSRERNNRKGPYPYYGASGVIDSIDDYKFDGEYVIISEDGENLRSRNTPIAFSAVGQFWVNNHAHILQGKHEGINELIICHFAQLDMGPYLTGAVQPKLNQQNLLLIKIPIPLDKSITNDVFKELHSLSRMFISNTIENQTLTAIRDTLLPKLISGEVRVKEAAEILEEV